MFFIEAERIFGTPSYERRIEVTQRTAVSGKLGLYTLQKC